GDGVHTRAAVLLGHFDAHEAQLPHLADGLQRKIARLVELGGDGGDRVAGEVARRLLDHFVLFGNEIKHGKSPAPGGVSYEWKGFRPARRWRGPSGRRNRRG